MRRMIISQAPRRKVFVSYHHAGDEFYKNKLTREFGDAFEDLSVRPDEVDDTLSVERTRQIIRDDYIRDATVTIVLVGAGTWRRKHVDWEIDSSLRHTKLNRRTGLLGVVLPTYQGPPWDGVARASFSTEPARATYCPNNIPPRLWDNVANGFAKMRPWPSSSYELRAWIDEAFQRRHKQPDPDLSRERFANNRPQSAQVWEPAVRRRVV